MPDGSPGSIGAVLDRAQHAAGGDEVSIARLIDALGRASHSAVMLMAALIVVTPLSGIPGLSGTGGVIIALMAGQMIFGRRSLWLPGWVLRRKVSGTKFCQGLAWLRRPARFIDRHTRARWGLLLRRPGQIAVESLCLLCGAAMPFLELVPFSSSILASAVALLSVALVVRDGAVALAGLVLIGGAFGTAGYLLVT